MHCFYGDDRYRWKESDLNFLASTNSLLLVVFEYLTRKQQSWDLKSAESFMSRKVNLASASRTTVLST